MVAWFLPGTGKSKVRTLASICINEEEFVERWLEFHYASFDRIIVAEGAARGYPPEFVTHDGLSTDRTAELIHRFPDPDNKIILVRYGWSGPENSTDVCVPAKIELRNACASLAAPGLLFTLDLDEFLHPFYVEELTALMNAHPDKTACAVPQIHFWQNTRHYITGDYADVPHFRLFRWWKSCRYRDNHNWPSGPDAEPLIEHPLRPPLQMIAGRPASPVILHYGFCERKESMAQKNAYYLNRGEQCTRPATTLFRQAALDGRVPENCRIHRYRGWLPFEFHQPARARSTSAIR